MTFGLKPLLHNKLVVRTVIGKKNEMDQDVLIWNIPSKDSSYVRDLKQIPFTAESKLGMSQIICKA